jgi:hypothetical protein
MGLGTAIGLLFVIGIIIYLIIGIILAAVIASFGIIVLWSGQFWLVVVGIMILLMILGPKK